MTDDQHTLLAVVFGLKGLEDRAELGEELKLLRLTGRRKTKPDGQTGEPIK